MKGKRKTSLKRKAPQALESMIRKNRLLHNRKGDQTKLREQIIELEKQMDQCIGPEHILRWKILDKKKAALTKQVEESEKHQQKMHECMAMVDKLEKTAANSSRKSQPKTIALKNRLLPPQPNRRNIFDTMSERSAEHWRNLRAHKQRFSVMYGVNGSSATKVRTHSIDTCRQCGVDKVVDKESAISVCPKCGLTEQFASHIFETKDMEKEEVNVTRQQSLSHMQKFSAQFERGYPCSNLSVLEPMTVAYSKFHFHDPSKVQACRTTQLMKNMKDIPKIYKRAPDRVTMDLTGRSIPEYTSQELSQLLNQRNRLRLPDEMDDAKHKKSFNNQIYMRQFGRSNGKEQSRLFPHAKTTKIHIERIRALEKESLYWYNKLGNQPEETWSIYPAT